MPANRIVSTLALALAAISVAALLAGCGGGATATQSAVSSSSLTTTSSVAPSASTSTSTSTTSSLATSTTHTSSSAHSQSVKPATAGGTAPGATKTAPGRFAVASAAFPHGGRIPVRYTCDGANVSPPLQWGKLPAGTSQLFLLALSLTAGAQGAVRWAVGGISPSSGGFAAGQLPAGAVVGRSSNGHVGWTGICPVAGKPQAIVMLVYALHRPLSLTAGFDPSTIQKQLTANSLGSGVVYGAYKKP